MKITTTIFVALLGLAAAAPVVDHEYVGTPHAPAFPIGKRQSGFVKVSGNRFDYGNGVAKYAAGTNAWWLSHVQDNAVVDKVFQNIAKVRQSPYLTGRSKLTTPKGGS